MAVAGTPAILSEVDAADIAEIASAAFTAVTAATALITVRQARAERQVAVDAYEAQTQPLITDLPYGLVHEEVDWHEASGQATKRTFDKAEVSVGSAGPEPVAGATVPIRNVGNGAARVTTVVFRLGDGAEAIGEVRNPVVPPNEITYASFWRDPSQDDGGIAESIGMLYENFDVIISYADASGRAREAVRLEIVNGQHPHVANRQWATDAAALRRSAKHAAG